MQKISHHFRRLKNCSVDENEVMKKTKKKKEEDEEEDEEKEKENIMKKMKMDDNSNSIRKRAGGQAREKGNKTP